MKLRAALFLIFAFAWGLTYWELPAFDPDLGWQLFGGAWILDHGAVPRSDPINAFNLTWLDYHWLAQIGMYKLYQWGGFELLRTALGFLMGTLFAVIGLTAFRASRNLTVAALVAAGSYLLLGEVAQVRPQMLSLLLLAAALLILSTGHGKRSAAVPIPHRCWELPALFILTVLLANMHVYWLFVPMLWFFYRTLPRMTRRRAPAVWYAWGGLGILGLAPLLSPYGVFQEDHSAGALLQNYLLILDYLDLPKVLKDFVLEFRSSFALQSYRAWLCVLYLICVARSIDRMALRYKLGDALTAITGLVLVFLGSKYLGVLAVFEVPFAAWSLRRAFERWPVPDRLIAGVIKLQPLIFAAGAAWAFYYAAGFYPPAHPNNEFVDTVEPFSLCKRIPDLPILPAAGHKSIRILTHFNHGGWCKFAVYLRDPKLEVRVTTDNRTQGVPPYHYEESFDLFGLRNDWFHTLQLWNPEVAVIEKRFPLASYMALAPARWKLQFQDDLFAVFTPVDGAAQGG